MQNYAAQLAGQKAEQPASTACLLARKCNRLARKMANMRNAICAASKISMVPTRLASLFNPYSMPLAWKDNLFLVP